MLSKATINAAIVFFVLSFALYLGRIYQGKHSSSGGALPTIAAPLSPVGPKGPTQVAFPAAAPTPSPAPAKKP